MMEINLGLYLSIAPCNFIEVLVTVKIFMQTTVLIRILVQMHPLMVSLWNVEHSYLTARQQVLS
uniref:Uncharacterized protein n=1 Tax=Varanus komodoensis TaxID=61221 RepID=A0A8D2J3D6_VARKO